MNSKYTDYQAGIGQVERRALDAMSRIGRPVVRARDLNKLGFSRTASNLTLSRLYKKGWLQRLQSGIYRIVPLGSETANPVPEDAWAIATEIFSPCYISGWTAAEHWELTEQIFNSTVIFTTHKQRKSEMEIAGLKYRTKFISHKDIFGIKKIWSSGTQIYVADIHRTIIDILDNPEIGGGGRHTIDIVKEYFLHKESNPEILCQYAEKLGRGAVYKRLGLVAEKFSQFPQYLLEKLRSQMKTGIIKLDPHGPSSGPIVTRWGVRLNIPLGQSTFILRPR